MDFFKELRCGNIISFKDNIPVVFAWEHFIEDERNYGELFETLKPIELTEEWLLKLGFEIHTITIEPGWERDLYSYNGFVIDDGFRPFDIDCIEIKYVHQIQNLYFAIKGEELIAK